MKVVVSFSNLAEGVERFNEFELGFEISKLIEESPDLEEYDQFVCDMIHDRIEEKPLKDDELCFDIAYIDFDDEDKELKRDINNMDYVYIKYYCFAGIEVILDLKKVDFTETDWSDYSLFIEKIADYLTTTYDTVNLCIKISNVDGTVCYDEDNFKTLKRTIKVEEFNTPINFELFKN